MRVSLLVQGNDALSARSFSITESMSAPFDASVVAMSRDDDLDLDALIGAEASLQIGDAGGERVFTGVVAEAEQVQAESAGLSTYALRIVPKIALLAHRSASRVYQHETVPEIVGKVLHAFGVHVEKHLDTKAYPKHEYRVQHAESDLHFIERLLEEAGISWYLEPNREHGSTVVLTDRPQHAEPKATVRYVEEPGASAPAVYVTALSLRRAIGTGARVVHDHDFKRHKGVHLTGSATAGGAEAGLAKVHHRHGAILRHGDHGGGDAIARIALEADRAELKTASYRTTALTLAPGSVFKLEGHPRGDLGVDKPLLVLENVIEGGATGTIVVSGKAAPASVPHRPKHKTHKPRINGVESGFVVGPKGESIHTDEHGRVKVQMAWDKEHGHDDKSSCFMRVSQAWAGAGFGMMAMPRVGQEVLVGFLDGDPDQPVVVGRVFNAENTTPWKLPEHRTKTGIRTASVPALPGEDAYNEIAFEDRKGHEFVSIQAEKDFEIVVKGSETERLGKDLVTSVGKNRSATVAGVDSTLVGATHTIAITEKGGSSSTRLEMSDRRIVCTTGEASVTFDGPDLSLEAQGNVTIVAHDGDVIIKGGPNVKINC